MGEGASPKVGRLGVAARVGSVLGIVVLSLSVVLASGGEAVALATPPAPVVLGATAGAGATVAGDAALMADVCVAGATLGPVGCAGGVLGVAAATAIYASRNSWVPVVAGLFNLGGSDGTSVGSLGCIRVDSAASISALQASTSQVVQPTATSIRAVCTDSRSSSVYFKFYWGNVTGASGVLCYSASTGATYTGATSSTGLVGYPNGSGGVTYATGTLSVPTSTLCPAGTGDYVARAPLSVTYCPINSDSSCATGAYITYVRDVTSPAANADYSQTTAVTCTLANGTTQVITQEIDSVQDEWSIPSCQAAYPGSVPTHIKVTGGWHGAEHVISDRDLTSKSSLQSTYPGCFDGSGAFLPGTCKVQVWINGTPCTVGTGHCPNWQTAAADYGDSVNCQFGSYVVPLSDCGYLRDSYVTGYGTQTWTGTDAAGNPYDSQKPDPVGVPAPSTGNGGQPSSGTNPNPAADPSVTSPITSISGCVASFWNWNPVTVVFSPVVCALKWAFVPVTLPSFNDLRFPIPSGWLPSLSLSDGSCGPLTFPSMNFGRYGGTTAPVTFVNTCSAPWPLIRSVTYYGVLSVATILIGRRTFFSLLNAVGMGVEIGANYEIVND